MERIKSLKSDNENDNRTKAKAIRNCKDIKQQQKKHKSDREKVILGNYISQQQNENDNFEETDSFGEPNFFTKTTSTPLKDMTNVS